MEEKLPENRTRSSSFVQGSDGARSRYRILVQLDFGDKWQTTARNCGEIETNSVFASVIEDDFVRLVNVLSVHPNVAEIMADIAVQSQAGKQSADDTNLEEQKKVAVAKHRRALKNNLTLSLDMFCHISECIFDVLIGR